MTLLSARSLSLTIGQPLFADLSFSVAPGDRLGLVAANGRGKSSLLRVLAGLLEPTSGDVVRARGLKVALVEQDVPATLSALSLRQATRAALPPDPAAAEAWRVDVTLDALDVPDDLREQALAGLSGGWQRTALLARAAVEEPDLLLLDEPTNHLDLARIGRLTAWLAALPRAVAVIIASHDRAFLDEATDRTLFLRPVQSRVFALPFGPARAALDKADAADARAFGNRMKEAAQLRRQAAKLKNIGVNSGSDLLTVKTRQLIERAGRIEDAARPAHREQPAGTIRLSHAESRARALVTLDDAPIATPDGRVLFATGQTWISPGDRVVVLGPNGAGKSLLLQAVLTAIGSVGGGAVRASPSISLGHMDQALAGLPGGTTPFDWLGRFRPGDQAARTLLAGAGIGTDRQHSPISRLSGGQKARLALLGLRLARPSFYLLDEPTNHLDIEGQEALEAELLAPGATCLLVSHDRSFVRAVGNRFWRIGRRRLEEVDSSEDFFRAQLAG